MQPKILYAFPWRQAREFLACITKDQQNACQEMVDDGVTNYEVLVNDVCKRFEASVNVQGDLFSIILLFEILSMTFSIIFYIILLKIKLYS